MRARRPWWRVILCMLGWHSTELCKCGQRRHCVYCETWDYAEDWIEIP